MKINELEFSYPPDLVAIEPSRPSRVLWVEGAEQREITITQLLKAFSPGDVLVINDTKVEPRRVFAQNSSGGTVEVLFVEKMSPHQWQVMLPLRALNKDKLILLPGGGKAHLEASGRPQLLKLESPLPDHYFFENGDMPLPPYIQSARAERHSREKDSRWYQTAWAAHVGSSAAPTASLHFSVKDLEVLRSRGVRVETLTLHVGLGTYLPVTADDLSEHTMHREWVRIPSTLARCLEAKPRVWALGTTVARALESYAQGMLKKQVGGDFCGTTNLLIQEGYDWKIVNRLLTNFHQPQSTLLALVMGFAGKKRVLDAYKYAIEQRFKLFSYGDLSVWVK